MFNEQEVFTPGEKIYMIRKQIGASQKEIAGDKITRNLISQIENDKTKLVYSTAKIIADNMKRLIVKKGIKNLEVTPEWLIEDEEAQFNNIANNYIKELRAMKLESKSSDFLKSKINEVEEFIKHGGVNLKKQYELYESISEIYFQLNDYCEGLLKLQLSIDIALKEKSYNDAVRLMLELSGQLCVNGGSYLEQIRNMHVALNLYNEYNLKDEILLKKIYFNTALYYSTLDKNKTSIEYLNKLKSECTLSTSEKLDVNLLIANCHEGDKEFDVAKHIYLTTLDVALKESEAKVIIKIYNNLGTIYRINGDLEKSLKYIEHAINIKSDLEPIYYARTLYNALENYIEMDNEELITKNLNLALEFIEKAKNNRMYYELIVKVYDYFISKGRYDIVYSILRKAEIGIKRKFIIEKSVVNLFFKASYELEGDNKTKKELFERGINLLKMF